MNSLPPETQKAFEERISLQAKSLLIAVQYDRPAILLAVYRSEFIREQAEQMLQRRLEQKNISVARLRIHEKQVDLPLKLAEREDKHKVVFFVSGVSQGGEGGLRTLRALNIRREYFMDHKLRMLLWLTENEARLLMTHAPDFWRFRHRVDEFLESPPEEEVIQSAEAIPWHDLPNGYTEEEIEQKIALREALLADLPRGKRARPLRVEFLLSLGQLYLLKHDSDKAARCYQQALELSQAAGDQPTKARSLAALARIWLEQGREEQALRGLMQSQQIYTEIGIKEQAEKVAGIIEGWRKEKGEEDFARLCQKIAEDSPSEENVLL